MGRDDDPRERRTFSRIPFTGKVAVMSQHHHHHWMAELIDISMKGVLVSRPDEWRSQSDEGYQLKIHLGDNKVIITMDASLAHANSECLGFCCEHIDLDSMTHLRRLLELNLGDEERINQELSALIFMHNGN